MEKQKLAAFILVLAAFIFLLLAIVFKVSPLVQSFAGIFQENKTEVKVEVSSDVIFYKEFIKNYQECKLSPSNNCYCPFTNALVPENYVVSISNSKKLTTITLLGNAKLINDCQGITNTSEDKQEVSTDIRNDILYFGFDVFRDSNVEFAEELPKKAIVGGRGAVFVKDTTNTLAKLKIEGFHQVQQSEKLYLTESKLCSSADPKNINIIDLRNGYLYKFDNEKIGIASAQYKLNKCELYKNSFEANNIFNDIFYQIENCNNKCSYLIKPEDKSVIPEHYAITIEDNVLVLYYEKTEITSKKFTKYSCLFTDYKKTEEKDLQTLHQTIKLNDYTEIEFYTFKDKTCFLPYTLELIKQRTFSNQVAISSAKKELIPK